MFDFLKGKKTHIVAALMVLGSLGSLLAGELTLVEFFQSPNLQFFLNGLGLSALRAGVSKSDTFNG